MTNTPLRDISISDFRRLEGTRVLPLDAPIVLLHGHNGAGKTSVLSALELALTGDIRSMRRHDPRYTAHLPFHGREFATLSVSVADWLSEGRAPGRMTVGGNRIEGEPALAGDAAQFYAERCYLDQVSLGQLLDLYQYREGKQDSALSRFVNELLGLEQLDALRLGLTDAEDIRRLKKLSEPLSNADSQAQSAALELAGATSKYTTAQQELASNREELAKALEDLGYSSTDSGDVDLTRRLLTTSGAIEERSALAAVRQSITALGGRIEGLSTRHSTIRLDDAIASVARATAEYQRWRDIHRPAIDAWHQDAARLAPASTADPASAIDDQFQRVERKIAQQEELVAEASQLQSQLAEQQSALRTIQSQLNDAQEQAGSLAEGLAALREHALDDTCPVCDRAFHEISSTHLVTHIDRKIRELTTQGAALRQLRKDRDTATTTVQRTELALKEIRRQMMTDDQMKTAFSQRVELVQLMRRSEDVKPWMDTMLNLEAAMRDAEAAVAELESISTEAQIVRDGLTTIARQLNVPTAPSDAASHDAWRGLANIADERLVAVERLAATYASAGEKLEQMQRSFKLVEELKDAVAQAAARQSVWDARVTEAKRRQSIARTVQHAASQARADIVHRVFTESLNDVWRSVFARLAPRETFVPAFGIPTASKSALQLTLETIHTSGTAGGSPQLMLSAGNLNTAALSLFIALHLAVEPLVPCLVFDDPVQSMDEVHITQFAALMRILSKQHGRQIIIAVHERELFQYLALELSPAFDGDELITIELDAQPDGTGEVVKRVGWTPDTAIAV
jgi:DNA repair protein SbcC/Rad50